MLLTALALSDDDLLTLLSESQVLHRVELALHSCKVLAAQNITWLPAWRAVHDLKQVLTSLVPTGDFSDDPSFDQRALHIWRNIRSCVSAMRKELK
jgi:hypothetical protein